MLRLELNKENSTEVVYNYFPERQNECGKLALDKATGEIKILSVAENDKFNRYLHHAVSAIEQYHARGEYCKKEIIAWY